MGGKTSWGEGGKKKTADVGLEHTTKKKKQVGVRGKKKKTPDVGLEPTTLGLRVPCSTVLS